MRLQWHARNGTVLDIRGPDCEVPEPVYVLLSTDGFGGGGCDVQTIRGPYQQGATFLGALLVPRSVSITFTILAQSSADLLARRRAVAAAFSPVVGEGRLVWIQDGVHAFSLRCVVSGPSPGYPSGAGSGPTWQTVVVDLTASDPCWFETACEQHLQGIDGGAVFPLAFPATFAYVTPEVTISNPGDVESPVTIRVTGPVTNPVITNSTTGEAISLALSLAAGETVEITTTFGSASCRLADGSNVMGSVMPGSVFWQMRPGPNRLTYSDAGGDAKILIQYSPRYTGV